MAQPHSTVTKSTALIMYYVNSASKYAQCFLVQYYSTWVGTYLKEEEEKEVYILSR